jgi:zinc transport system ATP-binding protein
MPDLLTVKNLSFSYGTASVLSDVSFSVAAGDFLLLAGPNGAGKSTLIKLILGLEQDYQGTIDLFGAAPEKFSRWSKIGYLPQRVAAFNPLFPATVTEVVSLGCLAGKTFPKRLGREDKQRIKEILSLLGIYDLASRPIAELSGGQQQRVFLARALVGRPELLIMDEPSTALDPEARDNFFRLIKGLNQKSGLTVIMITHDTAQAGEYANRLLYLDRHVIFCGALSAFCQSAAMDQYFGHFAHHQICHQH